MTDCRHVNRIRDHLLAEGQLGARDVAHVERCPACRGLVDAVNEFERQLTRDALATAGPALPETTIHTARQFPSPRRRLEVATFALAAAAVASVALIVGTVAGEFLTSQPTPGGPSIASPTATPVPSTMAPNPSPPLYEGPADEYFLRVATCLRGHGWEATVYPELDGLSVANATAANRHELPAALEKCQSEIGVLPPPEPLTEAEIRERYRFLVEARDCLIALGYEISEPPSEDAFVDSWPKEADAIIRSGPWSPFLEVDEGFTAATATCPQTPPA